MSTFQIDDSNWRKVVDDFDAEGRYRGRLPSSQNPCGFGSAPKQWDGSRTRTKAEVIAECRRLESAGVDRRRYIESKGWKVKNQEQTNFCWAHAPTECLEIARIMAGMPHIPLSAPSVACRVNGFKNQGGWGSQAAVALTTIGATPEALWPGGYAGFSRKWDGPKSDEASKLITASEYWDLPQNDVLALATCVQDEGPVYVGLDWWGHEVLVVWVRADSRGNLWFPFVNSWDDSWGDGGWGELSESKAVASDQGHIRAAREVSMARLQQIDPRIVAV